MHKRKQYSKFPNRNIQYSSSRKEQISSNQQVINFDIFDRKSQNSKKEFNQSDTD